MAVDPMRTDGANPGIRCWINQPSTLQPYHKYHGARGIWTAGVFYFTEGDIVGMDVDKFYLSPGWPEGTG